MFEIELFFVKTVIFRAIRFSISTQIKCQKTSILNNSFSINTQFKYKNSPPLNQYSLEPYNQIF